MVYFPKPSVSIAVKLVIRQCWWKVFDKAIVENTFSSKTRPFSHEKETQAFEPLQFYGSNHLSPIWTKNPFHRNTHPALLHSQKHLLYPHLTDVFEGFLSVYRIDRFLEILLYRAVNGVVNKAVNICIHLLTRYLTTVNTIFQKRSVC